MIEIERKSFAKFSFENKANLILSIKSFLEKKIIKNPRTQGEIFFNEYINKISNFSQNGKCFRGLLLLYFYELLSGKKYDENEIHIACAIELLQSGLLIHDDIIDKDETRRGNPTFFASYRDNANFYGIKKDTDLFGNNIAICGGDSAFFMAYESILLAKNIDIARFFTNEAQKTIYGEFLDSLYGMSSFEISKEDIYNIYYNKTARYTFSLPIGCSCILSNLNENETFDLMEIGSLFGILFQIKDDLNGIIGKEEEIGKPIGSDMKENKKTLLRYFLINKIDKNISKEEIYSLLGNKDAKDEDIKKYISILEKTGAMADMKSYIINLENKIKLDIINKIKKESLCDFFNELLNIL